ncbi:hypothetical protein KQI65_10530 [bacterium]|nr:hypothetical protein [bacterium]
MKAIIALAALCLFCTTPVQAQSGPAPFSEKQQQRIAENILQNLQHRIQDIRENALQLIIDLKELHPEMDLGFAQLPVMHILKSHDDEGMRILAAMALYHIGDRRGRFAVERRVIYDDSKRVTRNCARISEFWDADEDTQPQIAQNDETVVSDTASALSLPE